MFTSVCSYLRLATCLVFAWASIKAHVAYNYSMYQKHNYLQNNQSLLLPCATLQLSCSYRLLSVNVNLCWLLCPCAAWQLFSSVLSLL